MAEAIRLKRIQVWIRLPPPVPYMEDELDRRAGLVLKTKRAARYGLRLLRPPPYSLSFFHNKNIFSFFCSFGIVFYYTINKSYILKIVWLPEKSGQTKAPPLIITILPAMILGAV